MQQKRLIILLTMLLTFVFAACSRAEDPTPTPEPVEPTAEATQEAGGEIGTDPVWQRMQESGTMVVGTSADYPPFAFYTSDFAIDGYDAALIGEIAQKLGLELQINDMAFAGLGNALQLEQIDVAIAALSVTPEREGVVDFSSTYYVGEDAILGSANATEITSKEQLAGSLIGVQAGSIYEDWVRDELIESGIISERDLFLYVQADQAVRDLVNGRVNYVILDLKPAEVAAVIDEIQIVGQGLNRQRFSIAVPEGSATLQSAINRALAELQAEGRVAELAEEYLDIDPEDLLPIDPDQPVIPIPPPDGCIDGMSFVDDLNLDDHNMTSPPQLNPGQPFRKGWRVRNSGTCTWDSNYALVFARGNVPAAQMGGTFVLVAGEVKPGETYDFWVDLVAPIVPGTYQSFWTMRNGNGLLFGDVIWVGITVDAPSTATPIATLTPSPEISFTVDRTTIKQGECVTFSWEVENIQAVFFYAEGERWEDNGVPGKSSSIECPATTTTYFLRVLKTDGTVETRQITINVIPVPGAPTIEEFVVIPSGQIVVGQCVDIRWKVSGDVTRIRLSRNEVTLWDGAPLSGTMRDCPPLGTMAYVLEASGPGGTQRMQQNVNVVQPTQPTATPAQPTATPITPIPTATAAPTSTPAPTLVPPPIIDYFSVSPTQIKAGECVQISWRAGGGTTRVQILRNGAIILDNGAIVGNAQDCLAESGNYTYRLEASNNNGDSTWQEQTVVVSDEPTPPPLEGTTWRLTSIDNGVLIPGTSITAHFGEGGTINGSSGCNTYSGPYSLNGESITIGPLTSTQIICGDPEGIMEQENLFLSAIQSASTYFNEGDQLRIVTGSGTLMFTRA